MTTIIFTLFGILLGYLLGHIIPIQRLISWVSPK